VLATRLCDVKLVERGRGSPGTADRYRSISDRKSVNLQGVFHASAGTFMNRMMNDLAMQLFAVLASQRCDLIEIAYVD
jgi:hypothetical protein